MDNKKAIIRRDEIEFAWSDLITHYLSAGYYISDWSHLMWHFKDYLKTHLYPEINETKYYTPVEDKPQEMVAMLRTFGLAKTEHKDNNLGHFQTEEMLTEKAFRFNYWMGYHNLVPEEIPIKCIKQDE